jgi:fibronectin-binding autotransporter adhesin
MSESRDSIEDIRTIGTVTATADAALPRSGGDLTGPVTTSSTIDGRTLSTDGAKLDGIESSADVTDTASVAAAGALMDSELANIAAVKATTGTFLTADQTKLDTIETGATADQTKSDIEGLGIDLPANNLTGTVSADRLSTATTQLESDDSTKIATTAYVVDKITTLIGGAPSTLNDLSELAAAINDDADYNSTLTTALGTKLPKSGGILTGDVSHGDNVKAKFGTNDDLLIYHDGSHSYIEDAGTGSIKIKVGDFRVENASGSNLIKGVGDVATLHHAGSEKLATTSTGIDVTGAVTADGLVVDNAVSSTVASFNYSGGTDAFISVDGTGTPVFIGNKNGSFVVQTSGSGYSDKFTVDSLGNVSIGRTSYISASTNGFYMNNEGWTHASVSNEPTSYINRNGTDGDVVRFLKDGTTVGSIGVEGGSLAIGGGDTGIGFYQGADAIVPHNTGTNAARDAAINLGMSYARFKDAHLSGTVNAGGLVVSNAGADSIVRLKAEGGATDIKTWEMRAVGVAGEGLAFRQVNDANSVYTNRVIFDNSGNVGIGTSTILNTGVGRSVLTLSGSASSFLNFGTGSTRWGGVYADATKTVFLSDNVATFEAGGSEAMRIDSLGNVGIGTSSPQAALDINGQYILLGDGTYSAAMGRGNALISGQTASDFVISSAGSNDLVLSTGSADRLHIDSAGNVGIGTSTFVDSSKIQLEGAKTVSAGIPSGQLNVSDSTAVAAGVGGSISFSGHYNGSAKTTYGSIEGAKENATDSNWDGSLIFKTREHAGNLNTAMTIDSSGSVGIGTSSPSSALDVVGEAEFGDGTRGVKLSYSAGNNSGVIDTANTGDTLEFRIANSEKMRIDSAGNVLVGKSTTAIETVGTSLFSTGRIISTADGDDVAVLNRKTSDGDIAVFKKDGTTVGSIGVENSGEDFYINSTDDLILNAGGSRAIGVFQSGGALQNVSIYANLLPSGEKDIGSTGGKWRNAYLSGTANVGTVDLGNWTMTENAGTLFFATSGVNKMKLDASGNLTVVGDVTFNGTM